MRETQILRGLHKARAKMGNNFAYGMVPGNDPLAGQYGHAAVGAPVDQGAAMDRKLLSEGLAGAPQAVPASVPAKGMSLQQSAVRSAGLANQAQMTTGAPTGVMNVASSASDNNSLRMLSRGVAKLKGPGTTTSDSIPANLSRGEAVLPAKTVQKVGANNIARLIEKTNGKPPARGLRTGGHYEGGGAPLQEPAGPQTFKQRATNMFKSGKAAVGGMADSATAPFKTAVTGAKALGAGVLGAYAGNAAANAARSFDTPSATPVAQNANVIGPLGTDPSRIPTGYDNAPEKSNAPYNYFTDNDTGRNIGTNLNALAAISGVGAGVRGAISMGTGVISKTARAATGPLAAGALQGAAANVREGSEQATQSALAPRAEASPYAATTAAANTRLQHQGPMGDDVNPYHGDLSAQINAAMKNGQTNLASTGMRANDIYKTKQANGTVAYSGYGDGTGRTGKLVSGDGTALQGNGTVSTMPNDQTARTLSSAQSGATSAALQAAAARGDMDTVRQHYQSSGGTFAGRTAAQDAPDNSPQGLIMAQIQRGLASGQKLTPAGVAALQALNTTDKNYKANMFGHEISRDNSLRGNQIAREGYEKDLAIAANTNKRLLTMDGMDRTSAGSKAVDDYIKTASSAVGVDDKGVAKLDAQRAADLSKYIFSQVQPIQTKYGPMTLAEAASRDPDAFKVAAERLDSEKSLDDLINASAGRSITGVGSQNGGRTELAGSTRQNAGLINEVLSHKVPVGSALASHALMPFTDSTMVDFKDGRGGIVSVPLREIAKDRHAYTALQAMFAQQKGQ